MNSNLSIEQINSVYCAFNEPGFHWCLFLPAFIYAILAMFGVPLNASVCWVTFKNRSSLRCNTCILLALDSFYSILHQLGHFHFLFLALSGINFYPIRLALPIQFYSAIGICSASNQVALLSLDRLFSLSAPLLYRQLNQRKYIFCHLIVNAAITSAYLRQVIVAAESLPEWPCTGLVSDLFALPNIGPIIWYALLGVMCATIFTYLLVGIIVRLKTDVTIDKQQKIYRSLFLIVLINVGGYFCSAFLQLIFKLSLLPVSLQFWLFTADGIFVNIGVMANAPILYYSSMDYRKAYKKEFKIFRLFRIIFIGRQQELALSIRVHPLINK